MIMLRWNLPLALIDLIFVKMTKHEQKKSVKLWFIRIVLTFFLLIYLELQSTIIAKLFPKKIEKIICH